MESKIINQFPIRDHLAGSGIYPAKYRVQEELNLIHNLFPMMKEQLRIADFCRKIGLAVESIKALLAGKALTAKSFSFFSPKHKQKFTAEEVKLKILNC